MALHLSLCICSHTGHVGNGTNGLARNVLEKTCGSQLPMPKMMAQSSKNLTASHVDRGCESSLGLLRRER